MNVLANRQNMSEIENRNGMWKWKLESGSGKENEKRRILLD